MNKTRKNTFKLLKNAVGDIEYKNAYKCAAYLKQDIASKDLLIEKVNVLVAYGGGKDSTWVIAFIRLVQLILKIELGKTFRLHIITMVHLGCTREVLCNINSVFSTLKIFEDKYVSTPKIYSYGKISDFSIEYKIPEDKRKLLIEDILTAGHRSYADPRSTFCSSCNLHMISSFISQLSDQIHYMVTGDSTAEQKSYYEWVQNILKDKGLKSLDFNKSLKTNIRSIQSLKKLFLKELFPKEDVSNRITESPSKVYPDFSFIPVFNFTNYSIKDHWGFFKNFLNFNFSLETLNFTESDCKHPLLMAHIQGLKAETEERSYSNGIKRYLELAKKLMEEKEFHEELIEENLSRYDSLDKILNMRKHAENYSRNIGIKARHLISMIYSPIADKGKNLERYLERINSIYVNATDKIHQFLRNQNNNEEIANFLHFQTGLGTRNLRHLYKLPLFDFGETSDSKNILYLINRDDPHRKGGISGR